MMWLWLLALPVGYFLVQLIVLYLQIGTQAIFWDKWNRIPASAVHLTYVALGDSTAQGIGGGKPANSYPYLIREWLQKQSHRPVQLINLSVSGAKVADCLKNQIPQLELYDPQVITIEIGANDIKSLDLEQFEEEFKQLLKKLPKGSYVSDLPCFTGRAKKQDPKVVDANKVIKRLLKKSQHHYVALYEVTKQNSGLGYFAADYFHPNARAYKNWAKAFMVGMSERFGQ